jgi:hypothetical protein
MFFFSMVDVVTYWLRGWKISQNVLVMIGVLNDQSFVHYVIMLFIFEFSDFPIFTSINYSVLKLFTGFAIAAFID